VTEHECYACKPTNDAKLILNSRSFRQSVCKSMQHKKGVHTRLIHVGSLRRADAKGASKLTTTWKRNSNVMHHGNLSEENNNCASHLTKLFGIMLIRSVTSILLRLAKTDLFVRQKKQNLIFCEISSRNPRVSSLPGIRICSSPSYHIVHSTFEFTLPFTLSDRYTQCRESLGHTSHVF
jgi:hypothetical protein